MENQSPRKLASTFHVWQSPDGKHSHPFIRLDTRSQLSPYPGVLVITDACKHGSAAFIVDNLRMELPKLLAQFPYAAEIYWWLEPDEIARSRILRDISSNPVIAQRR
jgi:hypothetical protein